MFSFNPNRPIAGLTAAIQTTPSTSALPAAASATVGALVNTAQTDTAPQPDNRRPGWALPQPVVGLQVPGVQGYRYSSEVLTGKKILADDYEHLHFGGKPPGKLDDPGKYAIFLETYHKTRDNDLIELFRTCSDQTLNKIINDFAFRAGGLRTFGLANLEKEIRFGAVLSSYNQLLGARAIETVEAKRVGKEPNLAPLSRTVASATAAETGPKWDFSPPVAADAFLLRRLLEADKSISIDRLRLELPGIADNVLRFALDHCPKTPEAGPVREQLQAEIQLRADKNTLLSQGWPELFEQLYPDHGATTRDQLYGRLSRLPDEVLRFIATRPELQFHPSNIQQATMMELVLRQEKNNFFDQNLIQNFNTLFEPDGSVTTDQLSLKLASMPDDVLEFIASNPALQSHPSAIQQQALENLEFRQQLVDFMNQS